MNNSPLSRRDFLKVARAALLTASGVVGLAGLVRFFSYQSEPAAPTDFDAGPQDGFPVGSSTLLAQIPALLLSKDTGFLALSLVCPHLGCTVESRSDGFTCPCHGSRFDPQGTLLRGPAGTSLRQLRVVIDAKDHVHILTSTD